jgi:integrase
MRRGELMQIQWKDVDLQRGRILLELTKNGKPRFAYLNQLSNQVIASLEGGKPSDLIFPEPTPAQVTVAFVRACKAAGIEDFSLHDLRHTFCVSAAHEWSRPAYCRPVARSQGSQNDGTVRASEPRVSGDRGE